MNMPVPRIVHLSILFPFIHSKNLQDQSNDWFLELPREGLTNASHGPFPLNWTALSIWVKTMMTPSIHLKYQGACPMDSVHSSFDPILGIHWKYLQDGGELLVPQTVYLFIWKQGSCHQNVRTFPHYSSADYVIVYDGNQEQTFLHPIPTSW